MILTKERSAGHPSLAYIETVYKFLKDRQDAHYWLRLRQLGVEYPAQKLAVKQSVKLKTKYELRDRECYYNAAKLALLEVDNLDYVEGIATTIIPVAHAWLVDRDWGWVIDPTWVGLHQRARKPEHKVQDYFGVTVPLSMVRDAVLDREIAGPLLPHVLSKLHGKKPTKPSEEPR